MISTHKINSMRLIFISNKNLLKSKNEMNFFLLFLRLPLILNALFRHSIFRFQINVKFMLFMFILIITIYDGYSLLFIGIEVSVIQTCGNSISVRAVHRQEDQIIKIRHLCASQLIARGTKNRLSANNSFNKIITWNYREKPKWEIPFTQPVPFESKTFNWKFSIPRCMQNGWKTWT